MNTLFMIMTFSWLLTCTAADLWKTRNVRTTHCQVSWNCIIFPNVATCFFWVLHVTTLCAYQIHFLNCQHVHYVDAEWVALLLKINLYIYLLESISMICAQNLITLIDSLKAKQHMPYAPQTPASEFHYYIKSSSQNILYPSPNNSNTNIIVAKFAKPDTGFCW